MHCGELICNKELLPVCVCVCVCVVWIYCFLFAITPVPQASRSTCTGESGFMLFESASHLKTWKKKSYQCYITCKMRKKGFMRLQLHTLAVICHLLRSYLCIQKETFSTSLPKSNSPDFSANCSIPVLQTVMLPNAVSQYLRYDYDPTLDHIHTGLNRPNSIVHFK